MANAETEHVRAGRLVAWTAVAAAVERLGWPLEEDFTGAIVGLVDEVGLERGGEPMKMQARRALQEFLVASNCLKAAMREGRSAGDAVNDALQELFG